MFATYLRMQHVPPITYASMLLRPAISRLSLRTLTQLPTKFHPLIPARSMAVQTNGDLNNTAAERARIELAVDPAFSDRSFAIPAAEDDAAVRESYRPFLLDEDVTRSDWVAKLELSTVLKMVDAQVPGGREERLRVLVLYGSLRQR